MSNSIRKLKSTEYQGSEGSVDHSRVLITGANLEMRLSEADDDSNSSVVMLWRLDFSPAGPGQVLYLKSELTEGQWNIYSDNIGMARWMQRNVQGMLNPELKDTSIPVVDAAFRRSGDARDFISEHVESTAAKIVMTWSDLGEAVLVHSHPNESPNPRPHGVCVVILPALIARLSVNGQQAKGRAWPRDRIGRPFSTCLVGFAESWTGPR